MEINKACFQEAKWIGKKSREIEITEYRLNKRKHKNKVGIIVSKTLK